MVYATILVVIGALTVLIKAIGAFEALLKLLFPKYVEPKKFGKWAVVTGATDGIGKAFAFELASKGMNILLISRTESKLKNTQEEIKSMYPEVDVSYLSVDYSKFDQEQQDKVEKVLKNLDDFGILVNNVGMSYPFPLYFHELSSEELSGLIELNINATTWMTKISIPIMLEKKAGAILNIGSAAGLHPSPLLAIYSATKVYVETFTRALATEYGPQGISVQCHVPFFIVSKLSKYKKPSLFVPSAESYAKQSLLTLGSGNPVVSPHWPHRVASTIMDMVPATWVQFGSLKFHKSIRVKGLRKREREAKAAAEQK